jgi:hypothetical protein
MDSVFHHSGSWLSALSRLIDKLDSISFLFSIGHFVVIKHLVRACLLKGKCREKKERRRRTNTTKGEKEA